MKSLFWITAAASFALTFTSCSNQGSGDDPLGTGPYDAQGNYIENWADDPTKWSKPGKRTPAAIEEPALVASNDQPPAHSTPITPIASTPRETTRSAATKPVEVASSPRSSTSTKPKSSSRTTARASTIKKSPTKKSTAKSKTPTKPKSTRYVVKSGDSLSRIASKTGTSVSAIQRANGIKGTLIRPGQSLVVPKR